MESFYSLIKNIEFSKDSNALDIGAGGYCGEITTTELLHKFQPQNITLMEVDKKRCNLLLQKYPKCRIVNSDFFMHLFTHKYDLISIDLDSHNQFYRWDELLNKSYNMLNKNGYLITFTINDLSNISMLHNHTDYEFIKKHINETYETDNIVNKEHLIKYFGKTKFEFINSVKKNRLIQWILLKNK